MYNLTGRGKNEVYLCIDTATIMGKKSISEKNKKVISIITEKRYRVLRHIILLGAFTMLQQSARIIFDIGEKDSFSGNYGMYQALLPFVIFSTILYINIYLLMPVFFKGKYIQYLWLVITIIMAGLLIMRYISHIFLEPYRLMPNKERLNSVAEVISATIFIIPIVLATSTARLMQKWIRDRERINELDKLTVDMELDALKNQINPHFLFNMLNNVNVLVKTSPDKASSVIVKLSEFLRYQLYENNAATTSLMQECAFLSNFLNLEKVRRDNFNFTVTCNTPGSNAANILIPPNLFTTFVENAIKHSVDLNGNEAYVNIVINAENNSLNFSCTNSQDHDDTYTETQSGGLGLVNVKRRLQLLFADTYTLQTQDNATTYNINLSIPYDVYYSR
ncbi:MAG: histidine kinase [Bacteroidota bacterium]